MSCIPVIETIIKRGIASHGHAVMGVFSDPLRKKPSFAYSIGLYPQYGFEILMIGCSGEAATPIINSVAEALKNGLKFEMLKAYNHFANLPNLFVLADERAREYVVQADAYYEKPVPVVQFVMADREGRLPVVNADYDRAYMDKFQPLLWPQI